MERRSTVKKFMPWEVLPAEASQILVPKAEKVVRSHPDNLPWLLPSGYLSLSPNQLHGPARLNMGAMPKSPFPSSQRSMPSETVDEMQSKNSIWCLFISGLCKDGIKSAIFPLRPPWRFLGTDTQSSLMSEIRQPSREKRVLEIQETNFWILVFSVRQFAGGYPVASRMNKIILSRNHA